MQASRDNLVLCEQRNHKSTSVERVDNHDRNMKPQYHGNRIKNSDPTFQTQTEVVIWEMQ